MAHRDGEEPAPQDIPDPGSSPLAPEQIEYIKSILDYARDDAKQVYLRVSAELAVAVLYLTQLFKPLSNLTHPMKTVFLVGMATLIAAALCHFAYLQRAHHSRLLIARSFITRDAESARTQWVAVYSGFWKFLFHLGDALAITGTLSLGVVLVRLLGLL